MIFKFSKLKSKKVLSTLSLTIATPIVLAACGGGDYYAKTDVANMANEIKENDTLFSKALADKKLSNLPITLITAAGKVNDQSFNQSLWEAVSAVSKQAKMNDNTYQETTSATELSNQYSSALSSGKKIWLLSGFQQGDEIKNWLKVEKNKEAFVNNKIVVVGVDWSLDDKIIPPGQLISLLYKTQESGFVVGYAAAKYLAEKSTDVAKRYLSGFGGGAFAGVTDFLAGFLAGVGYWNGGEANSDKQIKFNSDTIKLDTGFDENANNKAVITTLLQQNKPQITLPVAGPLTGTTLNEATNEQLVIGVDTNQALAYPNKAGQFFSSIEKKIGLTAYQVLSSLLLNKQNTDDLLKQSETSRFIMVGSENATPSNVVLHKGIKEKFVGYSQSTIANATDKKAANDALAAGLAIFNNPDSVASNNKAPKIESGYYTEYPKLHIPKMTDSTKNQKSLDEFIKSYINNPTKGTTVNVSVEATVTTK